MIRRFLIFWVFSGMAVVGSLMAQEMGTRPPRIILNPMTINDGKLVPPRPVLRTITINNLGRSLLYISKIKCS